ncbi:hypothetical protein SUDANB95_02078 [Actinosynnema sp. ALI-1.44]
MTAVALSCVLLSACGSGDRPGLDEDGELGSIGTAAGEQGAREAVRAYLDAWASGNRAIACGLLTAQKARAFAASAGDGDCPSAFTNVHTRMSEESRKTFEDAQIVEVKMSSGDKIARVRLSQKLEGPLNGDDDIRFEYTTGRWQTEEYPKG